jgi:hypothetical protein
MICNTKFSAAHTICIKKKRKYFVKFFFTEIRFQNQKCADIDVEIAMSVLLLLRMIFVSHQQKPLIHTHNSFNSCEEKEEKPNFPIGVLELCFLFAVSKEKKELYYIS